MTGAVRLSRSNSLPSIGAAPPLRRGVRARLRAALARVRRHGVFPEEFPKPSPPASEPPTPEIAPQKLARKNLLLDCLEFSVDGTCTKRQVTRQHILDAARPHGLGTEHFLPRLETRNPVTRRAAPVRAAPQKRGRNDRHRARAQPPLTAAFRSMNNKHQSRNALTMRDMRQVDPHFMAKPALWVRQHALVVSLESIRAIILCDRMFLFDPNNDAVQELVKYLRRYLAGGSVEHAFIPFEFRCLDAILQNACDKLARTFGEIMPKIQSTLRMLPMRITAEQLEQLRHLEQALNNFYVRARKMQHVLQAVLDEDDDMAGMYLTEKSMNPQQIRNPIHHDEAETLLEEHLQTVDDLTSKAELLKRTIEDMEDLIEIHLDTTQNRLLLVDLIISAISSILAFGGMVTGILGMNLQLPNKMRFMPSSQYYFYSAVSGIFLVTAVSLFVVVRWCHRKSLRNDTNSGPARRQQKTGSGRLSVGGRGRSGIGLSPDAATARLQKKSYREHM